MSPEIAPSPQRPFVSTFTDIGPHRIHARVCESASGKPVVLVHGVIVSHRYMMPLAHELSPYFNVYALDLPAHGHSSKPKNPLPIEDLADVIAGYITKVCGGPAIVIGNSYGCQISAELAVRHPDLVDELVMLGPTVDKSSRSLMVQAFRLLQDIPRERLGIIGVGIHDMLDIGVVNAIKSARIMCADCIEEKFPSIRHRTLVVRGGRDPLVPAEWTEHLVSLLPNGELIVMDGAPHDINYSSAPELREILLRHLGLV